MRKADRDQATTMSSPSIARRIAMSAAILLGVGLIIAIPLGADRGFTKESIVVTSGVLTGGTGKTSRWYVHRVRLENGQEVQMTFREVLRLGQRARVRYSRNVVTNELVANFVKLVDETPPGIEKRPGE